MGWERGSAIKRRTQALKSTIGDDVEHTPFISVEREAANLSDDWGEGCSSSMARRWRGVWDAGAL